LTKTSIIDKILYRLFEVGSEINSQGRYLVISKINIYHCTCDFDDENNLQRLTDNESFLIPLLTFH
jgi:hypothetical protein